jgi:hypothetical protein
MMAKLVGVLIMILRREHTSTYGITLKGKGQGQGQGQGKAVKQIIPFEGNEKAFETILKQLNR